MAVCYYGRRSFAKHFDDLMNDTYFEINRRMIGLLPKFRGSHVDHPLTHLRDLHTVCNALRPRGVNEADFMLRMFLYSLTEYAKSWLFSLSVVSMPQWEQMRQLFLKEHSIKQHPQETTYEYLERFRNMWDTCPDYSLPNHVVALSFLDGMNSYEREIMDEMAGGEIMECYSEDVWDLICQRAADTQPYPEPPHRQSNQPTHYDNAPESSLEDIVQQLAEREQQNQERTDKALAEMSKQISRITEVVLKMNTTISSDDYLDMVLETESMEEVCEDTESWSLPTLGVMDDKITSNSTEEEEDMQDETCLIVVTERNDDLESHAKNLISSQGSVGTCITDFLVMPDYSLSSHVQDHILGVSFGVEKVWGSSDEMCREIMCIILGDAVSLLLRHKRKRHSMFGWKPGWDFWRSTGDTPIKRDRRFEVAVSEHELSKLNKRIEAGNFSIRACKNLSKGKRTFRRENRNWKRRKKTGRTIRDDELFLFYLRNQKRYSNYVWKPAWDKAAQKVRTIYRKFDGVHPWAPNL